MSFLFRVVYAAHASGTHHKLVLRALEGMRAADAEGWRRLFLSRVKLVLEGSKEPDRSFRDFQNHVLHPGVGPDRADWGGAPEAAEKWFARMVDMLERRRWDDAVFAAGVLSHYVSDPMMPLHTGSSDAETKVHRGTEWTISRDFEAIWAEGAPEGSLDGSSEDAPAPVAAERDDWLGRLVTDAAKEAHLAYDDLVEAYDLEQGARRAENGLTERGRAIAARQLRRATAAIAHVFDRAVTEAGMSPPKVDLTVRTVIATLGVPAAWVAKKLADAWEGAAVRRIAAEIARTGALERNVPRECRVVRKARAELEASGGPAPRRAPFRRARLERGSPVVDAPSIGPKTADRLKKLGVETVGDLLGADPKSVADGLGDSRITAPTVAAWRDQAGLLVRMPRLRRAEAVLLVACGYRDVASVASADAVRLRDQLLSAAQRPELRRVLRSAIAPDIAEIRRTIAAAREIQAGL